MSAFETADMQSALPGDPSAEKAPAAAIDSDGKEWTKPLSYNYDELAQQGPIETTNWEGNNVIYEWDEEYGEVGPKHPELELMLFGDPDTRREHTGLDFTA